MSSEQYFSYIILMKGNSGKFWCFVMTTSVAKIVSIYLTTFKIWVNKSNICHMQCDSTPNLNCPFGICKFFFQLVCDKCVHGCMNAREWYEIHRETTHDFNRF